MVGGVNSVAPPPSSMCEGGTGGRRQVSPLSPRATQIKTATRIQAEKREEKGRESLTSRFTAISGGWKKEADALLLSPICSASSSVSAMMFAPRQPTSAQTRCGMRASGRGACQAAAAFKADSAAPPLHFSFPTAQTTVAAPSSLFFPSSALVRTSERRRRRYQVTPASRRFLHRLGIGLVTEGNSFESSLSEQAHCGGFYGLRDGGNDLFNLSLATRFVGSAVLRHKKWMMAPFGGAYLSSLANKEEATHRGPPLFGGERWRHFTANSIRGRK